MLSMGVMSQVSFDEIREHFGDDTIKDRFEYLHDKMNQYISERYGEGVLRVSDEILQQVIVDYFADIYRLKKFHKIDRVNLNKIVAYEIYWILRRKPIQIIKCDAKNACKEVFANEGFLTTFIAHESLDPNGTVPMDDEQEKEYLGYLKHIYYCLKYRNIDKQWLETILLSIELGKCIAIK